MGWVLEAPLLLVRRSFSEGGGGVRGGSIKTQDAGKAGRGEWGSGRKGEKPCNSLASGLPDRVTPPPMWRGKRG